MPLLRSRTRHQSAQPVLQSSVPVNDKSTSTYWTNTLSRLRVEHPTSINLAAACKTALEQQEIKDGLKQAKEANLIL